MEEIRKARYGQRSWGFHVLSRAPRPVISMCLPSWKPSETRSFGLLQRLHYIGLIYSTIDRCWLNLSQPLSPPWGSGVGHKKRHFNCSRHKKFQGFWELCTWNWMKTKYVFLINHNITPINFVYRMGQRVQTQLSRSHLCGKQKILKKRRIAWRLGLSLPRASLPSPPPHFWKDYIINPFPRAGTAEESQMASLGKAQV